MQNDADTITTTKEKIKVPSLWQVVLYNDDFTPIDFVIKILQLVFHKSLDEAASIAGFVHEKGRAVVGTYTREIAETKVDRTMGYAVANEHPLLAKVEQA